MTPGTQGEYAQCVAQRDAYVTSHPAVKTWYCGEVRVPILGCERGYYRGDICHSPIASCNSTQDILEVGRDGKVYCLDLYGRIATPGFEP